MLKSFARTSSSSPGQRFLDVPPLALPQSPLPGSEFPEARVEQPISFDEAGRVSFRGTSWRARLSTGGATAEIGSKVLVLGRQSSTTLLVMPL